MKPYAEQIALSAVPLGDRTFALERLSQITVLMGRNGSGKSVLLRAWRDQAPEGVHYVVPERAGALDYTAQFTEEEASGSRRRNASSSNSTVDYRGRIVARVQAYLAKRGNTRSHGQIPVPPDEIEQLLQLLIPEFAIELLEQAPSCVIRRVENGSKIVQVQELSSGEAQMLTLGLDIALIGAIWTLEAAPSRVLLVDEPDAHIHPDFQVRFADFLVQVSRKFDIQCVVATHSMAMLCALGQFGQELTRVVYLSTTQERYRAQSLDDVHRELAACLGGHVLMGPLFGAPIWIVEGDDDYRIWSQVARHNTVRLSVLSGGGDRIKKYQSRLESLFQSMMDEPRVPVGYALLDGDKPLPKPQPANRQTFVRYLGLNCHEAENLYLTAEVLKTIGHTPDSAVSTLRTMGSPEVQVYVEALAKDRRTADIKRALGEIVRLLDSKLVLWTSRVAAAIGAARPSGELAEYLGDGVLNALWPSDA